MDTLQADRRRLLRLGLASGAALWPIDQVRAGVPAAALDGADDHPVAPFGDAMLAHRKLAYSADTSVTFSWLRGVRYAAVDAVLHPLWTMHLGTVFRTRDLADGYEVTAATTTFYTDIDTGAFLRQVKNPVTGARVDIHYFPPKAQTLVYGRTGPTQDPAGLTGAFDSRTQTGPAWIDGDTISVLGDHIVYSSAGAPAAKHFRVNDLSTFIGSARDVADPATPNPPSTMMFNDLNTWPAWLGMGDTPGAYISRAWGRKVFAYADMPQLWLALMAEHHPQAHADPASLLNP